MKVNIGVLCTALGLFMGATFGTGLSEQGRAITTLLGLAIGAWIGVSIEHNKDKD